MAEQTASTGLFYSGHVPTPSESTESPSRATLLNDNERQLHFDIPKTVEWIRSGDHKRVAQQFPDSLLPEAVPVTKDLQRDLPGVKFFILADTSYASCCVDEVAAKHASCDSLVHYGDACLSAPTQNIPVRYVLGRLPLNLALFEEALSSLAKDFDTTAPVALLCDSSYAYALSELAASCSKALGCTVEACQLSERHEGRPGEERIKESLGLGRILPPTFEKADDARLVFVGSKDSSLLPLWLLSLPQCSQILHYDPESGAARIEQPQNWRALRRRLFLVEKVRDARTIGLVVGTVAVAGHREAVQRVRALAKREGKKVYVLSVGKVNVAKLANFSAEIDVFVLLSCPFGVLLDTADFDKPLVSLFEAEIALNENKDWMAGKGWTSDFGTFVDDPVAEGERKDETPDVSLVTGRVRTRPEETGDAEGKDRTVALYTAGDYFAARSWRGLDDTVTGEEGLEMSTELREGRRGRAAGYENEPDRDKKD